MDSKFENLTTNPLNDTLQEFYVCVQSTKASSEYRVTNQRSLQASINRHETDFITINSRRATQCLKRTLQEEQQTYQLPPPMDLGIRP